MTSGNTVVFSRASLPKGGHLRQDSGPFSPEKGPGWLSTAHGMWGYKVTELLRFASDCSGSMVSQPQLSVCSQTSCLDVLP